MEFHCWGISHKSTSLEVREKFAFNKEKIDEIIANLKSHTPFDNGFFDSSVSDLISFEKLIALLKIISRSVSKY